MYSYHAVRSQRQEALGRVTPDKAERVKQWRERLGWLRSTPRLLVIFAVGVGVALVLRLDSRATVVPLDEAKGQVFLRSLHTYETAVHRLLASSPLNTNKITVDASRISTEIKRQFPELQTVAISLPLSGSRPVVHIQPAVPVLILATRQNGLYVVDTTGKALISGNQVTGLDKLKLPVVQDESGLVLTPGAIALPARSVAYITEFVGQLHAKQLTITSLSMPAAASELQVRVKGAPYYIKCNLQGDAREEAGRYLAIREKLNADGKKAPAEYIDVRVPNRVYYK